MFIGDVFDEKIIALYDNDHDSWWRGEAPCVDDRLQQLTKRLERGDLLNIHLIGHSEGAATIGKYLSNLADNSNYASEGVKRELQSAYLLECPTGFSATFVSGFGTSCLSNLPERLSRVGIKIELADIWNVASLVHMSGVIPGWENNSYSYDSRMSQTIRRTTDSIGFFQKTLGKKVHNDVLTVYPTILANRKH
jgi:hypothetical protein